MPVPEAAKVLGISPEAVRNRLSRGTLLSVKEGGRVFVLIDRDMVRHTERSPVGTPIDTPELIEEMRGRIDDLRDQLSEEREARRRADAIIMQLSRANAALADRLPELEAAPSQEASPGTPHQPETAPQDADEASSPRPDTVGAQEDSRRPWWVRWFGDK